MEKVELSQIAATALKTAQHIGGLVADGHVERDRLLVVIGEHHHHVGHQYFEKKLIEYLHETTGLARVFDERDVMDERFADIVLNNLGQPITVSDDFVNHNAAKKAPYDYATGFAENLGVPVRNMDAPHISVQQFDDYIPHVMDVIDADYKTRYADNPVAAAMMTQYKSHVFSGTPSHYGRRAGMLKRNLFMMDQVVTNTAQQDGVSLLLNGKAHVVNMGDAEMPSLTELLHANGKDIVAIALHEDDAAQLEEFYDAEKRQQTRLAHAAQNDTQARYYENINLVIAEEQDGMTEQGLENVKRKNGDVTYRV